MQFTSEQQPTDGRPFDRPKGRHLPYRILSFCQFALHDCISRHVDSVGDVHVSLRTGPFARLLAISGARLSDQLQWLATNRLIQDLERGKGWALFQVRAPQAWNDHRSVEDAP